MTGIGLRGMIQMLSNYCMNTVVGQPQTERRAGGCNWCDLVYIDGRPIINRVDIRAG